MNCATYCRPWKIVGQQQKGCRSNRSSQSHNQLPTGGQRLCFHFNPCACEMDGINSSAEKDNCQPMPQFVNDSRYYHCHNPFQWQQKQHQCQEYTQPSIQVKLTVSPSHALPRCDKKPPPPPPRSLPCPESAAPEPPKANRPENLFAEAASEQT